VQVLRVPQWLLFPLILLFCMIGAYAINNTLFDVGVMLLFGVLGYLMNKFGYEPAPLALAFVLGPIFEKSLRQSLRLSRGDFSIFFTRPLSAVLLIMAAMVLLSYFFFKKQREVLGGGEKTI